MKYITLWLEAQKIVNITDNVVFTYISLIAFGVPFFTGLSGNN